MAFSRTVRWLIHGWTLALALALAQPAAAGVTAAARKAAVDQLPESLVLVFLPDNIKSVNRAIPLSVSLGVASHEATARNIDEEGAGVKSAVDARGSSVFSGTPVQVRLVPDESLKATVLKGAGKSKSAAIVRLQFIRAATYCTNRCIGFSVRARYYRAGDHVQAWAATLSVPPTDARPGRSFDRAAESFLTSLRDELRQQSLIKP